MSIKRKKWLVYFFVYICLYVYHLIVIKFPGDDFDVSNASSHYNLYQWLTMRYFKWSGRLFPDGTSLLLIPNKVWLWRMLNPLFFIVLAYGLIRIWRKDVGILEFLAALFFLGYIKDNVLSSGFFWVTGSMYYLWAVALGLFAMIPFADQVFRKEKINDTIPFILFLVLGFFASVSNEQAALCMACFAILSQIILFRQKVKLDKRLLLLTIIITIGTCILIFAPGSRIRYVQEVARWYPGFDHLTLKEHFYIGTIWGFEKLFDDMKYLLFLLSIVTIIPWFKEQHLRKSLIFQLFFLLLCMVLLLSISGFGIKSFYNFEEIKHFHFSRTLFSGSLFNRNYILAIFPYLFWGMYSILLIYLLLKSTSRKIFVLVCLMAVIASLGVMFFSPTIYASRNRVLTVPAILLGIMIIGRIKEHGLISKPFYLCIFAAFPIINLAHMLYMWITKGFTPFL